MDSTALEEALIIEENKELKQNLRQELCDLHAVRDGFNELLLRLSQYLVRATAPPFIDPSKLEDVAPPQDTKVDTDFEEKTASVSYSKHGLPLVEIACRELPNGAVQGLVLSPTETDLNGDTCGLWALAPLVVTWAKRSLVRNSDGVEWWAASWSEAEKRVISTIQLLETNWAPFNGIEHRLVSDINTKKQRVSFEGLTWACRSVKVFIDADLQEELEVGPLEGDYNPKEFDLRKDELHAIWNGDGMLTFLERIDKVHHKALEKAAAKTLEKFQAEQLGA
ncbi:hypothetical protein BIW11_06573 [Tropilaelaps mercedesae]|uniref:Uncharacterized protein n=1 Tax=Tropilaelaps mercedesae TaxID=418985 RepID=A0A1V9XXG5_9ACAR|nr:hypothetical protein BIW11_06573 [Tropilaelaps mercedesae]